MSTLIRPSRAIAVVCISAATLFGTPTMAAADPAPIEKLSALVAPAYNPAECTVSKTYPQDLFLARIGCGKSGSPTGPTGAIYSLYGNAAELNKAFDRLANSGSPLACPGAAGPGASAWPGGMVVCTTSRGPQDGAPNVSWTRTADLLVVSASGNDLDSLYAWWLTTR